MNDILIKDTDKSTNPWLELIIESNKNTEAPTAYWNDMQNALIQYEFWPRIENYSHLFNKVLGRLEVEEFYQKLSDATENDEIDFSGIEFRETSFLGAKFLLPVNFYETQFLAEANIKNTSFLAEAKFELVNFRKSVCLENVNFGSSAIFDWAQFASASNKPTDHKVSFSGEIRSALTFTGCKFWSDLNFERMNCYKSHGLFTMVNFQLAEFHGEARFYDVRFETNYSQQCTFHRIAHFAKIELAENANFWGAAFRGKLIFGTSGEGKAIVGRDFFLDRVKVERDAIFSAEIEGDFNCHDSQFTDVLDFKNFKVVGKIVLSNSLIKGEVKLHNLKNSFRSRGTNFVNRPPELFGSDLKPNSDLAFTLPAKPNPDHINIYEDLRQHAERLGKLEEKKRFIHAELSCRAIDPQKSTAERFVWWRYYITSDYGTSIYRPLGWLFVLFLISVVPWVGYAIWFSPMSVWSALSYNILQAVPFTGHLSSALLNKFPELPMSLHFIAGPVALLNPIFWFLIGLGMRYKLRLAR